MKSTTDGNKPITMASSLFILALSVVFGANTVAVKMSLSGLGPFFVAGVRFGIGASLVVIWMWSTGKIIKLRKDQIVPALIVSILFTIQIPLFNIGLSKTTVSRAVLILNMQPFFVLILAHFFIAGDRINFKKIIGILLGFTGIIFVFLEKKGDLSTLQSGDYIILISSVLWGCNAVYSKIIIDRFEPILLAVYPMIFAAPILIIGSYFFDKSSILYFDTTILLSMAYQILISASVGFVLWMELVKKYGAVSLNAFVFIMPVSGVILGGLILKETITYKIILAMLFVTLGLIVTNYKPRSVVHLKT